MIFEEIVKIIKDQLGDVEITEESKIIDDLKIDSVTFFQLIIEIEDAFDIRIEDAENIVTVSDAVRLVEEYKKNR